MTRDNVRLAGGELPCVLVTGGFGYLGSRIAAHLADSGKWWVRVGSRRAPVIQPAWLSAGEVVQLNFEDPVTLLAACRGSTAVVHLAAPNEIESAADPEGALLSNALYTRRLLAAAEAEAAGRVIRLSTIHVYGSPLFGRITEATPTRPVHPYAIAHRCAEDWVLAAHARGGVACSVLRLSNGFGAPLSPDINRWTLLVNDLCRQAVTTRKCILRSTGAEWRDFIPVTKVADAIDHVLSCDQRKLGDGLFNLGSGRAYRVLDMAELVAQRCQALYGYRPGIQTGTGGINSEALDYSIAKLHGTGFFVENDYLPEIDATLRFCYENFTTNVD